jgi:hypothetical protein
MKQFIDIEIAGIDTRDYPDFVDAFIESASVEENNTIREATEEEIDSLNEDSDLVYELVMQKLF